MLPLFLDVKDKSVLLIGGGPVAFKRAQKLLAAGAKISAYAHSFIDGFFELPIDLKQETFKDQSLDGYWLVITATDDPDCNAAVAKRAKDARIFCNNAGDAEDGDLVFPLSVQKSGFTVAIADQYRLPFLLTALGVAVMAALPDLAPENLEKLAVLRRYIIEHYPKEKEELLQKLAQAALENQDLEEEPDEIIRRFQRE